MKNNLKSFNNLHTLRNKIVFAMATVFLLLINSVTCFALGGTVYEIYNIDDLNNLRQLSANGETFKDKTIILKNDINITANEQPNGEAVCFKPVFDKNVTFSGTFDGNNKTLHCNLTNGEIMGNVGKDGTVKNLKVTGYFEGDIDGALFDCNAGNIENVNINATIKDEFTCASAICFRNYGTINNCEVRGNIYTNDMGCAGISDSNNGNIFNCKVFAELNNCVKCLDPDGEFQIMETGGITSFNYGLISKCEVKSNLSNIYNNEFKGSAGGIASTNNGLIENSTFKGTITAKNSGGISSSNYTIIKSCNVNAIIKGRGDIGYAWEKIKNEKQGIIENCEFTGKVEAENKGGVAAVTNHINPSGNIPQIKNCKINGISVERAPDCAIQSWDQIVE